MPCRQFRRCDIGIQGLQNLYTIRTYNGGLAPTRPQITNSTMKLEFHHINFVADDVDRMHDFYTNVLGLANIPEDNFVRTPTKDGKGFDGKIKFATDGDMQMHLAQRDFTVAFVNGQVINPIERGHIAFRTDDLPEFLKRLDEQGVPYSDYGTTFSAEWHQVFFQDPEGNVIEVHQGV